MSSDDDALDALNRLGSASEVASSDAEQPEVGLLQLDRDTQNPLAEPLAAARRDRAKLARCVKTAFTRRAKRESASDPVPATACTRKDFHLRRSFDVDQEPISYDDVAHLAFGRHGTRSGRSKAVDTALTRAQVCRVREATAWRYVHHANARLEEELKAAAPGKLLVASYRIKWDETEQVVGRQLELLPDFRQKSVRKEHVFCCSVHVKTSRMAHPALLPCLPLMLQRTTAECLSVAIRRTAPFGPWDLRDLDKLPSSVQFLIFVLVSDQASSNLKLYNQFLQVAIRLSGKPCQRPIIMWFVPCFIHVLHRSLVPILTAASLANELYRAACVLSVGTYWESLLKESICIVGSKLSVKHNSGPDRVDAIVARQIAMLTLGEGLPEAMMSQRARNDMEAFLGVFQGDWTSHTVMYFCSIPDCAGGQPCRKAPPVFLLLPSVWGEALGRRQDPLSLKAFHCIFSVSDSQPARAISPAPFGLG